MAPPLSRRVFLLLAGAVWLPASVVGTEMRIEDWSEQALGAHGIPAGWRSYVTPGGRAAYNFTIVNDGGRRALDMKSADDHSTIAKEIHVDLGATPVLEWSWKVKSFPAGADLRRKQTSDATAHMFVVWPRFPALLRSQLIGYVWDATLPSETVVKSRKSSTVTFVVVRSGIAGRGEWLVDARDVEEDYRRIFGQAPEAPGVVALSIDTNDTHASAEALVGPIRFRSRAT